MALDKVICLATAGAPDRGSKPVIGPDARVILPCSQNVALGKIMCLACWARIATAGVMDR
jgi:hypothetical protein